MTKHTEVGSPKLMTRATPAAIVAGRIADRLVAENLLSKTAAASFEHALANGSFKPEDLRLVIELGGEERSESA